MSLRRGLRLGQRFAVDLLKGYRLRPPVPCDVSQWHMASAVSQALGTTPNASAKQHNIALAAQALSSRPIPPGGMFSFWGWLGAPTPARGYLEGRALRGDRLVLETGGGLCQLAGAIYFAGLQAGLRAVERHAHSVDLYTDETRYTPLGSDATVSFGFKDLRMLNPHNCPVAFDICANREALEIRVMAERKVTAVIPEFRRMALPDGSALVETWTGGAMCARSIYRTLNSATATSRVSPGS